MEDPKTQGAGRFVGLSPTDFERALENLRTDAQTDGILKTLAETSSAMLQVPVSGSGTV